MTQTSSPYKMRPPVLSVRVEDTMDVMIVRDTTRKAANLIGFSPAHRAQLASAAATLAELVLKTGEPHTVNLNGVLKAGHSAGLQISAEAPWLEGYSINNVIVGLKSKMGDLVHEIMLDESGDNPTVIMIMWLSDGDSAEDDDE